MAEEPVQEEQVQLAGCLRYGEVFVAGRALHDVRDVDTPVPPEVLCDGDGVAE